VGANPARIPPQTPPAGGESAEAKRKILSPRKKDFRFAESVLKPHALPEYLEGRTPKEKHPFLFQKKFAHRQIRNARSVFSFGVAGVLASAWGFGSFVQFPLEKSSRKVYNYSTTIKNPVRRDFLFGADLQPSSHLFPKQSEVMNVARSENLVM
jgi:hypothetical protein